MKIHKHIDYYIMYIISVITPSPFYYRTHLFTHPSLSHFYTGIQCDQYICIFAVEGVNADCRMPTGHSYVYLVTIFTAGQYDLSRT